MPCKISQLPGLFFVSHVSILRHFSKSKKYQEIWEKIMIGGRLEGRHNEEKGERSIASSRGRYPSVLTDYHHYPKHHHLQHHGHHHHHEEKIIPVSIWQLSIFHYSSHSATSVTFHNTDCNQPKEVNISCVLKVAPVLMQARSQAASRQRQSGCFRREKKLVTGPLGLITL